MATRDQLKRRLLLIEILSLLILVASLVLLSQEAAGPESPTPYWLLLPALASLTTFLSFLGLMYLRWVKSVASGTRKQVQNILFAIMALTLLGIWALAIAQTWQSLNAA